uniref:Uncharacterized protein n=2 Tax=Oryza glaberrima TaxID=4538 RepID=I1NUU8_ORYGL
FREPILPQIPKSYLRIKDSNMKVEVVMKYLAGKLGLTQSHLQRAASSSLLAGQKCQRQHLVLITATKLQGRRRRRRRG